MFRFIRAKLFGCGAYYLQKYPAKYQPNKRTFSKLVANLKTHGSFKKPVDSWKKSSNVETIQNVLLAVTKEPSTSVRQIKKSVGIPKSTTHLILPKKKNFIHTNTKFVKDLHQVI